MQIKKIFFYLTIVSFFLMSCNKTFETNLGKYESVTIPVNPEKITNFFTYEQYTIDSICPLTFPDNYRYVNISKVEVEKEKIYIMDSDATRTVYVFNKKGEYLYKLGERGRATNEYIWGPSDFFVDEKENVHILDKEGMKILVFNNKGKLKKIVGVCDLFPHSFGLLGYNKYIYCKTKNVVEEDMPVLLTANESGKDINSLIYQKHPNYYIPDERTFFRNDGKYLSHIPILSDSVLVFKNQELEKVIRFDFNGKFITKEIPQITKKRMSIVDLSKYKGVDGLISYQETDSLMLLKYSYNSTAMYWFHKKNSNMTINANNLFSNISLLTNFYLTNKTIVATVGKDEVEYFKRNFNQDEMDKILGNSSSQIKDLITGKISLPALLFFTIK